MPQKKNPDIAELLRGRTGRSLGGLVALATVLKGLPLAYDRDLQEDKTALFGAVDGALESLYAADLLAQYLVFDKERLESAAADPGLLATDVAEELVRSGTPFRSAHEKVGRHVRGGQLKVPWNAATSLRKRDLPGAPHPKRVAARARAIRQELAGLSRWLKTSAATLPGE
jgi:argininosuccinate lyase